MLSQHPETIRSAWLCNYTTTPSMPAPSHVSRMRSRAVYILSPRFKCTTGAKNCHQPKSRTLTTPKAGRMWSSRNAHSLLVGTHHGTVTLEDSLVTFYKTKHTLTTRSSNALLSVYPKKVKLTSTQKPPHRCL